MEHALNGVYSDSLLKDKYFLKNNLFQINYCRLKIKDIFNYNKVQRNKDGLNFLVRQTSTSL